MSKRLVALAVTGMIAIASTCGAVDLGGHGNVGASLGGMLFTSGEDFANNNQIRLIGQVMFRYNVTQNWTAVIESGYGWNSYPDDRPDDDTLAVVVPTTFGVQYRFRSTEKIWPLVGAGFGLYALGVKDTWRSWSNGNNGTERLTWTSPGVYGRLGAEYLFTSGASINVDTLFHAIFSEEAARFPDGWGDQNTSFWQFRVGVSYYFKLPGSGGSGGEGG